MLTTYTAAAFTIVPSLEGLNGGTALTHSNLVLLYLYSGGDVEEYEFVCSVFHSQLLESS
jgi:hypothetical protein